MAAFQRAASDGASALEVDARLTKDGKVVIFHDSTLSRTTDGGGTLSGKTAEELRALDAGGHFSEQFRGEKIPFLEEVFEAFGGKLLINVELKNYLTPLDDLVERVCELIRRHALQGGILISSFHPASLRRAGQLLPDVPRALLAMRGWRGGWARSFVFAFGDYAALHPHMADTSAQQVHRVHKLGRRLHAWAVSDAADCRRLRDWGADGIITDDPKAALTALEEGA